MKTKSRWRFRFYQWNEGGLQQCDIFLHQLLGKVWTKVSCKQRRLTFAQNRLYSNVFEPGMQVLVLRNV